MGLLSFFKFEYKDVTLNDSIKFSVPVIMDFDTIIKCGYRLKTGQFQLPEMLRKYILYNEGNLSLKIIQTFLKVFVV